MTVFHYFPLADANKAKGVVIVIDVLRAFTTAANAFNVGAKKIYPVVDIKDAFELRLRLPGSLIMGEEDGVMPPGFDFGNSPAIISIADLNGRILIQRTSAGTQGILQVKYAQHLFAASFVVAHATAQHVRLLDQDEVSFVITGESLGRDGDEDRACGAYIQALIMGNNPDPEIFTARVGTSKVGRSFLVGKDQVISDEDFLMSIQVDEFNFSLPIRREVSLLVMD